MGYLLDANVFIAANNLHYGLDFCPAFWDWLVAGNESERVFSVEKVGDELHAVGDELSKWAAERADRLFLRPDASIFPATRKIKIPDACIGLGIKCMTPYEMRVFRNSCGRMVT